MKLKEIYSVNTAKPVISYEVFPPKNDADGQKLEQLFLELEKLMKYQPSLISVTYGAGGSNQSESVEIIKRIKTDLKTTPMPHFTCVSTSEKNIKNYLKILEQLSIENILALRGDIPGTQEVCHDFKYASELVEYIKKQSSLSVAVAGYPEVHKEAVSPEMDIEYLKNKVDKGADVIYTQLFFNNAHYFNFCEKCQSKGINIPIIPGILPVTNFKTLEKMTSLSNVDIPQDLLTKLNKHKDDKDYIKQTGIEFAIKQCKELIESGVRGMHFYTLNKEYATGKILGNLL